MPHRKRVLLKNKNWALALLDNTAEVTIVHRNLLEHLEVKATDDFIQVETVDMRVSTPDRVYKVTLQLEGDIKRTIHAIFWDRVVKVYDILLALQDWPPDFVCTCPYGEEVIKPSFSPLVPEELTESYSIEWALAQAPALYRNHVGWDRNSPYHVIPIKSTSATTANGFRDSKGNTIKHRLLWGKVADLKEMLPKVHVVHTLGHQSVGMHVAGNTLADEAAKSAVAVATVAAVTRSSSKPDTNTLAAIKVTVDGTPYPKGFPNKYQYYIGSMLNAEVKIPGVGVRDIPNKDIRPQLIKAAHEGVTSAHAGVAATISLLQARYWWPGLYKETMQYILCCDICQQIKVSTAKCQPQTPLLISNRPLQCVYLDHCGLLTPDSAYKYILAAVDSCSRFIWVWPQSSADVRTVIKDLRVFIGTYAVAVFHSDQGPAFASRAFKDTMASLGVQLQYSSPFHPEGNSVMERLNRNLKQSLTARVLGQQQLMAKKEVTYHMLNIEKIERLPFTVVEIPSAEWLIHGVINLPISTLQLTSCLKHVPTCALRQRLLREADYELPFQEEVTINSLMGTARDAALVETETMEHTYSLVVFSVDLPAL
ncbi:hypothetical protein NDU88_005209 [Pleurodeles waltl]|uniref:Gypsy retrotransposon integrase-like protein 1 n=1 Tax=Pleurodeles waltl TaxID=8319 RepID=A0AAV7MBF6_PLEWA|nr:hypothetical protein NDU88_005209 [Pleurodeles waltl]